MSDVSKAQDSFGDAADAMTLKEMLEFKRRAQVAYDACKALYDLTSPVSLEGVSSYIGLSFSCITDELENMALSLDSRIDELENRPYRQWPTPPLMPSDLE